MALQMTHDRESMRDWPLKLRMNASACTLAEAIYYVRAEAYGIAITAWDELEPRVKQTYVEHAQDVLEAVRPAARTSADPRFSSAKTLSKVIGQITASEPWGA